MDPQLFGHKSATVTKTDRNPGLLTQTNKQKTSRFVGKNKNKSKMAQNCENKHFPRKKILC